MFKWRKDQGRKRLTALIKFGWVCGEQEAMDEDHTCSEVGLGWRSWAGGQDRISDDKASTPSLRSNMGSGQGTSSGMFGRPLDALTQGYMVKGTTLFSSPLGD